MRPGLLSAPAPGDQGAPYDRKAALYDRGIGSRACNRLVWRAQPGLSARALKAGELGPPRTSAELGEVAADLFGPEARVTRTGSMAWLCAVR